MNTPRWIIVTVVSGALGAGCAVSDHAATHPEIQSMSERGRAEREIVELHDFFTAWFRGDLANDGAAFARFEEALADGFTIITPGGIVLSRDRILDAVRDGHGSDASARIWIEDVRVRQESCEVVIATYEEWQRSGEAPARGRLSTVVFQRDDAAMNGWRWLHVHETWLPVDQ